MTVPPPSIILVLALGSVDALLTFLAVLAIALGIFADLPSDAAWIATLLAFAGVFGAVHVALKIASLIGLYLAQRWAVVLGTLAFAVSWPLFLLVGIWSSPEGRLTITSILTAAFFLACTLPHWKRMT